MALGSNQNDPLQQLSAAMLALDDLPDTRVQLCSAFYRSAPMGPVAQPDFINAVAGLLTRLSPQVLLAHLQALEVSAGRRRDQEQKWGPRPLDLDILTYGMQRIDEPGLRVPHPGIHERNFVLLPLLDVAPDLEIPDLGPVHCLAAAVTTEGLERLD